MDKKGGPSGPLFCWWTAAFGSVANRDRMERQDSLEALIEPTLTGMGYEMVRIAISGRDRPTLQVMAERKDGVAMTVDDCETISRALSAKLDVEDPIASAYTLEVSSPGIDRPLVRLKDYQRFAGHVARLETREPRDGRRRFTGRIVGAEEGRVRIAVEDGEVEIPFDDIARAKLVLTDELIAATANSPPRH
jgi:ribosome maturation factor RimP